MVIEDGESGCWIMMECCGDAECEAGSGGSGAAYVWSAADLALIDVDSVLDG